MILLKQYLKRVMFFVFFLQLFLPVTTLFSLKGKESGKEDPSSEVIRILDQGTRNNRLGVLEYEKRNGLFKDSLNSDTSIIIADKIAALEEEKSKLLEIEGSLDRFTEEYLENLNPEKSVFSVLLDIPEYNNLNLNQKNQISLKLLELLIQENDNVKQSVNTYIKNKDKFSSSMNSNLEIEKENTYFNPEFALDLYIFIHSEYGKQVYSDFKKLYESFEELYKAFEKEKVGENKYSIFDSEGSDIKYVKPEYIDYIIKSNLWLEMQEYFKSVKITLNNALDDKIILSYHSRNSLDPLENLRVELVDVINQVISFYGLFNN